MALEIYHGARPNHPLQAHEEVKAEAKESKDLDQLAVFKQDIQSLSRQVDREFIEYRMNEGTLKKIARVLLSHFTLFRGWTKQTDTQSPIRLSAAQQEEVYQVLDKFAKNLVGTRYNSVSMNNLFNLIKTLTYKDLNSPHLLPVVVRHLVKEGFLNYYDIRGILRRFPEQRLHLLTKWIDSTKTNLFSLPLEWPQLEEVAPHLTHAHIVSNCNIQSSNEYKKLISSFTKAKTLVTTPAIMSLEGLTELETLVVKASSNLIRPYFPTDCTNLKKLVCDETEYLPPAYALPNLMELTVIGNLRTKYIPNYPALKVLRCENSNVDNLPEVDLMELHCVDCPDLIKILPYQNLEVLDCSLSKHESIVDHYGILRAWDQKLNKFRYQDSVTPAGVDCLPELPKLRELSCRGCYLLKELPPFPALRKLDCRDTALTLPHLPKLEILDARSTTIKTWPELTMLRELNLACSDASCLPASALATLEILNVSSCLNLKELPTGMKNLKVLYVSEGMKLPEDLPKTVKIVYVDTTEKSTRLLRNWTKEWITFGKKSG